MNRCFLCWTSSTGFVLTRCLLALNSYCRIGGKMKFFAAVIFALLTASAAFAATGDILRSQPLAGQPLNGVRGLAMDWDTGLIWVAGPDAENTIKYATMDPVTMTPGTWMSAAFDQYWVFDIGYGYDSGGTKYLLMNDQSSPFTKMIDPADGSYDGSLPDYYSVSDYTDGCGVDWTNNYVYLSSHGSPEVVYYDGATFNPFASITDGLNMGLAVGWEHVFVIRTSPWYTIEVYQINGTFVESIPLNSWSGNYVIGLSCGQEDVVGNNESLFFADFISQQVHEIEVGDYTTPGSLTQSTWGEIKAGFGDTPDGNNPSMNRI